MKPINITKSDGTKEKFSDAKLTNSLRRAGATPSQAKEICEHIKKEIVEGISTDQIYKHAFFLLRKQAKPVAAKYSLKRAIAELGPSGFPFEKFVAEIFKAQGYKTKTGQLLKGGCISHEVDVLAVNENELIVVEAKFHNQLGTKSDAKVPMYVKSRIDDLMTSKFDNNQKDGLRVDPWIVTNTKFTKSAIDFGSCFGLNMVDWNHPRGRGLKDLVEDADLHPVTALTSLSKKEKEALLLQDVVLAKTILIKNNLLEGLGITPKRMSQILAEVRSIIK